MIRTSHVQDQLSCTFHRFAGDKLAVNNYRNCGLLKLR